MELGKKPLVKVVVYCFLAIWCVFTLFPIYWTVVTSVKTPFDVYSITPKLLPFVDFQPTLEPWLTMFRVGTESTVESGRALLLARNSLLAALGGATGATLLGALAAYGLARFRFRRWNNEDIGFFLISQRILPPIALAVPYFVLFSHLRMLDKLPTLILIYTAMNTPLMVWLLRDFFVDQPPEIEEAALVDGCSRLGAFFRIALPLAAPGVAVAFLFSFIFSWNEFLFAFTLTFQQAKTLPFLIAGNVITRGPRFWDIAAQGTLVMIPPILVALIGGRYLVRGLALGAVK
jgi:multiple sugar transport system permease protein